MSHLKELITHVKSAPVSDVVDAVPPFRRYADHQRMFLRALVCAVRNDPNPNKYRNCDITKTLWFVNIQERVVDTPRYYQHSMLFCSIDPVTFEVVVVDAAEDEITRFTVGQLFDHYAHKAFDIPQIRAYLLDTHAVKQSDLILIDTYQQPITLH